MNSSDLWILCGRHLELCAFLHLSLGATIPFHTSSIDHFTWMNWVQVQSRRLSDVVWRLFLNGATWCSLPCCLSVTRSAFYWAALLPLWEGKCFSWVLHGSYKDVTRCQNKPGQKAGREGENKRKRQRSIVWQPNDAHRRWHSWITHSVTVYIRLKRLVSEGQLDRFRPQHSVSSCLTWKLPSWSVFKNTRLINTK